MTTAQRVMAFGFGFGDTNPTQPGSGSNNPGSSGGNGYGGNFSINDLIRLNLLKSITTNLLKSAKRPPGL